MTGQPGEEDDRLFAARAKTHFDDSVAGLDAATRSRLTQARTRAMSELQLPGLAPRWMHERPRALVAGVAVAVLAGWLLIPSGDPEHPSPQALAGSDDLELLLEDEFEMLEELEFYAWLDEQAEIQADENMVDGAG